MSTNGKTPRLVMSTNGKTPRPGVTLFLKHVFWYPRFMRTEKMEALKAFVERNLKDKLIDMDIRELMVVMSLEMGALNGMFPTTMEFTVTLSAYDEQARTARICIHRDDTGGTVMMMRFTILNLDEDMMTPIEVEYSGDTTDTP